MGAHSAPSTHRADLLAGLAGRGALTAAAALALAGGTASMAFATEGHDAGHDHGHCAEEAQHDVENMAHEDSGPKLPELPIELPDLPDGVPGADDVTEVPIPDEVTDQLPEQVRDQLPDASSSASEESSPEESSPEADGQESDDQESDDQDAEDSPAPEATASGILGGVL